MFAKLLLVIALLIALLAMVTEAWFGHGYGYGGFFNPWWLYSGYGYGGLWGGGLLGWGR